MRPQQATSKAHGKNMVLMDDFYSIVSAERAGDGSIVYGIKLNAANPILRSHFPGRPLVPGTCLLQILKELACRHSGLNVSVDTVRDMRFIKAMTPDHDYRISFSTNRNADGTLASAGTVKDGDNKTYTKFSITYKIIEP